MVKFSMDIHPVVEGTLQSLPLMPQSFQSTLQEEWVSIQKATLFVTCALCEFFDTWVPGNGNWMKVFHFLCQLFRLWAMRFLLRAISLSTQTLHKVLADHFSQSVKVTTSLDFNILLSSPTGTEKVLISRLLSYSAATVIVHLIQGSLHEIHQV